MPRKKPAKIDDAVPFLNRLDACRFLPLAAFILLPAMAVRLKQALVATEAAFLWPEFFVGDTRSWWKAVLLVAVALWMLLHALIHMAAGWRPRRDPFSLALLAAAGATVVSALLSNYPVTAWLGYTAQYEGAAALLAYLIGIWYVAEMAERDGRRLFALRLAGGVAALNAVLGIREGLGWNFWQSGPGRFLMGAGDASILFRFADSGMAYGTLYQPNHYGMFMVMLSAMALGMLFVEKKPAWRCFWVATMAGGSVAVVYSESRMAVAILLLALGFGIVYLGIRILRARHDRGAIALGPIIPGGSRAGYVLPLGGVLVAAAIAFVALGGAGRMRTGIDNMLRRVAAGRGGPAEAGARLTQVGLKDNRLGLVFSGGTLELAKNRPMHWEARWTDGSALPPELKARTDKGGWTIVDFLTPAGGATLRSRADGRAFLDCDGVRVLLYEVGDRLFATDDKGRLYPELRERPRVDLGAFGRLAENRGYIWSRALALVPEHPWFGSGPGSFALVFPNDDQVGRQRFLGGQDEDKGHGIWMTWLAQLGIVGLVLYCLPVAISIRRAAGAANSLRLPILLGIGAFLLAAITNDSTVGTTPIFCVLLGLGAGLGREAALTSS